MASSSRRHRDDYLQGIHHPLQQEEFLMHSGSGPQLQGIRGNNHLEEHAMSFGGRHQQGSVGRHQQFGGPVMTPRFGMEPVRQNVQEGFLHNIPSEACVRGSKISFSEFDGSKDPNSWFRRAEKFDVLQQHQEISSWAQLKDAMNLQFELSDYQEPHILNLSRCSQQSVPSHISILDGLLKQPLHHGVCSRGGSCSMAIKGTIGYVPPEYGIGGEISTRGDVYSYGVVLLELFIGKRPTDEVSLKGLSIHEYVKQAFPRQVAKIVDPKIVPDEIHNHGDTMECLMTILQVGIACTMMSPHERPTINVVLKDVHAARRSFLRFNNLI